MVTHGIDEAILSSDRMVVLGNPPGPSVVDVIPVELPQPRDRVPVLDDPHYRTSRPACRPCCARGEVEAA